MSARWRVHYADGSTFASTDGNSRDAPPVGVVCVVQSVTGLEADRELVHRFDWYWWRGDERSWYGGDLHGYLDQAMRLGASWPKQGRNLLTAEYEAIVSAATREALP